MGKNFGLMKFCKLYEHFVCRNYFNCSFRQKEDILVVLGNYSVSTQLTNYVILFYERFETITEPRPFHSRRRLLTLTPNPVQKVILSPVLPF